MISRQYRSRFNYKFGNKKLRARAVENNSANEKALVNNIKVQAFLLIQNTLNL